jgi:hypothetical protein
LGPLFREGKCFFSAENTSVSSKFGRRAVALTFDDQDGFAMVRSSQSFFLFEIESAIIFSFFVYVGSRVGRGRFGLFHGHGSH